MKRFTSIVLPVFLAAAGFVWAASRPQEMQAPKPGKEHALLKPFEGNWEFTSKFIGPDGKDMISKGTESARLIAGGLFVIFDIDGELMGEKFVGHGTMGYDIHKKKYTGSWIDSMSTATFSVEATCDESGKKWTETMEGPDPMTGKPFKMRITHELKDADHRSMAFYMNGPDGKEMHAGTIEYTRKK